MLKNIQRCFVFVVCVAWPAQASEDFKKPEWHEYAQLVKARSAINAHNYQEALRLYQNLDLEYQKSPTAFKQHQLVAQGLWLTHTMLSDLDRAQAYVKGLLFTNPLVTALHALGMKECAEKNKCIAYSLSNKQPLAAIMAGDKACSQGKLHKACDYYAQAAEFMGTQQDTLTSWYTDLLQYRKAQIMYHYDSTTLAVDTLKTLHQSTQFQTIKDEIRAYFDQIISKDKSILGLQAFAQITELTDKNQADLFLHYLKQCLQKETVLGKSLEKLQSAVDTVSADKTLSTEQRQILLDYYENIKTNENKVFCAQQAYQLLPVNEQNNAKMFIKKFETIVTGYKESPDFFARCVSLIEQGISAEQPLSKNDKKKINAYLQSIAKEPAFGTWMEEEAHNKMWQSFNEQINQNPANNDLAVSRQRDLSELPLEERLKELIKGDTCNKTRFNVEIMPHLHAFIKSPHKAQQAKGLEILFLLSGHESWLSDSNMKEIHELLSSVRCNHKSRQHLIDYFLFCLESLVVLRNTPKFTQNFNDVCTALIGAASKKRDPFKKNLSIKCYYEKFIAELHYMMAINCHKMFLEKKHYAIQHSQIITIDDMALKNQFENCMLAACYTYDLIEKEVHDPVILQEALVRNAEIAMHYPDIFTKCTKKSPFKSAKDALEKYLKDKPNSLNVRFLLASLFADGIEVNSQIVGKDLGRAIQELTTLRSLKSGYVKLAECLKKQKKESNVHACYQEGIKETQQPVIYFEYARYLIEKNRLQEAGHILDEARSLELDSDEISTKNLLRLLCLFKRKEDDSATLVELLKDIKPTSYQLSTIHFIFKHLTNNDFAYFTNLSEKLLEQEAVQADHVQAVANLGVFTIKLSYCQEDEDKAYEQYIQGLKLLENAAKHSSIVAVEILANDPIYSKNAGLREGLISYLGKDLLQAPVSEAAKKREMLFPFKGSLKAQAYLLLYDFTVKHTELENALINTGCLFMDNPEYAYINDKVDMTLIDLVNTAFGLTNAEHMPGEVLKHLLPARTMLKGSKLEQISVAAADQLGRYGIYTFLTRINLAAAKHMQAHDIKKTKMYLDRAIDSLLDLPLMTTYVQPKNHVYRILYFIEALSVISNTIEEHSGIKYYEEVCGLLLKSKVLYERSWAELAFTAGNRLLKESMRVNNLKQQSTAIQYLEIAANHNHDRAIDALIVYSNNLIDTAVKKFKTIAVIDKYPEIEKGLHWLTVGKQKKNKIALESLLKYYTRAVNQEQEKPRTEKNLQKLNKLREQLKEVCDVASLVLTDYIIIKDLGSSKNYEVLYDMETHELMLPTPENQAKYIIRYV